MFKKVFLFFVMLMLLPIVAASALGGYLLAEIYFGDDAHMAKERIREILSKEAVLYYADGKTQLGSLYGGEHRQYIELKSMPQLLLDAVVAAEDDNFYSHIGIDVASTVRAVYRNIIHKRHEGASTITQQTVKNLYGRQTVDLSMKIKEAINAFKLERKFSKRQILEFYLNQFHVAGNGRGIGIAAKYYFDKEVSELKLSEAAFIAGSVKAPDRYTPFTKRTIEKLELAKKEAKIRKNYVIIRMYDLGFIDSETRDKSLAEEVPFRQGRFQFNELAVVELVQRHLKNADFFKTLGFDSMEQLASVGIKITTTLQRPIQIGALYAVRQNLSRLDLMLQGFQKESEATFIPIQMPEKLQFYVAKIAEINTTFKQESLKLSFGIPTCNVPTDAIDRVALFLDKALYKGLPKSKKELLTSLHVGDYVMASIRDINSENREMTCDLERRPKIQGGLIALDKGKIVSMIGGFSPHEYNRAINAQRQPGSTFKTMTYYPALQLGWNILDRLSNARAVHKWQGEFYYPRPDHKPAASETNFVGAGAKSENLASVWLLHHLTDRLTYEQFLDLLKHLELYKEGESEEEVYKRIRPKFNVRLTEDHLRAGAFEIARSRTLDDGQSHDERLRNMNFASEGGFDSEASRLVVKKDLTKEERGVRLEALKNTYTPGNTASNSVFYKIDASIMDLLRNAKTPLQKLYLHDDFRYSLGMYYAAKMCKEMGIESQIQWVPSYPLGANVVTLAELALAYQTIQTGRIYQYFSREPTNQFSIIERIQLGDQTIWEAEPSSHQLIDESYSSSMLSILRGTVTQGTAYAAHNAIILNSQDDETDSKLKTAKIRVPTFGKTGTTNNYVNATYVGFLPYPSEMGAKDLNRENIYTIAAYVGYDSNEPMKRGGLRIAGGTGALPAWIGTANTIIRENNYAEKLNWQDLIDKKTQEIPFNFGPGLAKVNIASIHSSTVTAGSTQESTDNDKTDANTYGDYDVRKTGSINLTLPGKIINNIFTPSKKVAFFTPFPKDRLRTQENSEQIEDPEPQPGHLDDPSDIEDIEE